jgi:GxxExxY protein
MNQETRKPGRNLQNRDLTERIIGAALRVHRALGPGFLETFYEEALSLELTSAGIFFERQKLVPIFYGEHVIGQHRLDLIVDRRVIVELKAIECVHPIHFAQVITYLKLCGCPAGLLLNFNVTAMKRGVRRLDHPDLYSDKKGILLIS